MNTVCGLNEISSFLSHVKHPLLGYYLKENDAGICRIQLLMCKTHVNTYNTYICVCFLSRGQSREFCYILVTFVASGCLFFSCRKKEISWLFRSFFIFFRRQSKEGDTRTKRKGICLAKSYMTGGDSRSQDSCSSFKPFSLLFPVLVICVLCFFSFPCSSCNSYTWVGYRFSRQDTEQGGEKLWDFLSQSSSKWRWRWSKNS